VERVFPSERRLSGSKRNTEENKNRLSDLNKNEESKVEEAKREEELQVEERKEEESKGAPAAPTSPIRTARRREIVAPLPALGQQNPSFTSGNSTQNTSIGGLSVPSRVVGRATRAGPTGGEALGGRPRRIIKTQEKQVIVCEVEFDCELHSNKTCYFEGMNPLKDFELEVITQKDIIDVNTCIKLGVDYIIMPYVRNASDVKVLKEMLEIKGRNMKILSKINDRIALQHIDEILAESDGIVISRGFLGIDVPITEMAFIQHYLSKLANKSGKPVLVVAQIMDSMIHQLIPTRAEASDIANAVADGIDAIILSDETSTGPFFKEACSQMSKICYEAE